MEQAIPVDTSQPTVQQMFAVLLEEIALLRKQNEEQQRQLDNLRNDTAVVLRKASNCQNISGSPQFSRLPLEIRRMIWRLAVPSRLLGLEDTSKDKSAPLTLPVPAVAQVCRESRQAVLWRDHVTALVGKSTHLSGPSQLWRLGTGKSAHWTWFTPYQDVLLVNERTFAGWQYYMAPTAQHIVIDYSSISKWSKSFRPGPFDSHGPDVMHQLVRWVECPECFVPKPASPSSAYDPVFNLRTIDIAMCDVTEVDRNYPPNFVSRLFAGDHVRIVDLRDKESVLQIRRMLVDEFESLAPHGSHEYCRNTDELDFAIASAVANQSRFKSKRTQILSNFVRFYYQRRKEAAQRSQGTSLTSPFRNGELDLQVPWVKELTERLQFRLVHVFVRSKGMSDVGW